MKKQKFLSPDGYVDEASLLGYIEHEIPKAVQSRAIELMLKCQEHGSKLKNFIVFGFPGHLKLNLINNVLFTSK